MIVVTILVSWLITGSFVEATSIGLLANGIKTGTYYTYERLWGRIAWGIDPLESTSP